MAELQRQPTLAEAAQFLRNAAPREFDAFKAAFERHTEGAAHRLVLATSNIKQTQGQLQQCYELRNMLREIK